MTLGIGPLLMKFTVKSPYKKAAKCLAFAPAACCECSELKCIFSILQVLASLAFCLTEGD